MRLASQSPVRVVVRWRCVVAVLLPSLPTIRYAKLTGLGASAWQVTVLAADTERLHYPSPKRMEYIEARGGVVVECS